MPLHCSNCNISLRIALGCDTCKDFTVCTRCYGRIGHQHDLKQVVLLFDLFSIEKHTKGCGSQVPVHCYIRNLLQSYRITDSNPPGICKLIADHFSGNDLTCNCLFCKKMFLVYKFHSSKCQEPLCRLENCKILNDQIFKRRFTSTAEDSVLQKLMKIRVIMKRAQNPSASTANETSHPIRNTALLRKFTVQRCIRTLVHASNCAEADCMPASCQKMKRLLAHIKVCKHKVGRGCIICKQLCTLCVYHARTCTETRCNVLFCAHIKRKIRDAKVKKRSPNCLEKTPILTTRTE